VDVIVVAAVMTTVSVPSSIRLVSSSAFPS
jgi:hypothetical protein